MAFRSLSRFVRPSDLVCTVPRYGKRPSNHFTSPRHCFSTIASRPLGRAAGNPELDNPACDQADLSLHLKPTGHSYWGFVIYRCAYGDDAAWARLVSAIKQCTQENLEYYGSEDLMDSLNLSIREDASLLKGASKDFVRRQFKEWVASAEADGERLRDGHPILASGLGSTPRYQYCIHVDEDALHSINSNSNSESPLSDVRADAYVNLIKANWALPSGEEAEYMKREIGIEDPTDEGEKPVEGCRMTDVGWMKVSLRSIMPGMYLQLQPGAWDESYTRPPEVAEV